MLQEHNMLCMTNNTKITQCLSKIENCFFRQGTNVSDIHYSAMVAFETVIPERRERKVKEDKDEEAGCVKSGVMNLGNYLHQCS